jgi:hypothetical protein
MCVNIVKEEYDRQGNLRFPAEVVKTCTEDMAKILVERVYRGDSFTKYRIEQL